MDDEFEIIMAKRIPSQPRFRLNYDLKKKSGTTAQSDSMYHLRKMARQLQFI